jgi:hypothetical protein
MVPLYSLTTKEVDTSAPHGRRPRQRSYDAGAAVSRQGGKGSATGGQAPAREGSDRGMAPPYAPPLLGNCARPPRRPTLSRRRVRNDPVVVQGEGFRHGRPGAGAVTTDADRGMPP